MTIYKYLLPIIFSIIFFGCDDNTRHQEIISNDNNSNQEIKYSNSGNIKSRTLYKDNKIIAIWTSTEFFNPEDMVFNYYSDGTLKSKGYKDKN